MTDNKELQKIMSININNLKETQFSALKEHAINTLTQVADHIKNHRWDEILEMLSFSPGGDDMGIDNCFIDFRYSENHAPYDISDIVGDLKVLNPKKKKAK